MWGSCFLLSFPLPLQDEGRQRTRADAIRQQIQTFPVPDCSWWRGRWFAPDQKAYRSVLARALSPHPLQTRTTSVQRHGHGRLYLCALSDHADLAHLASLLSRSLLNNWLLLLLLLPILVVGRHLPRSMPPSRHGAAMIDAVNVVHPLRPATKHRLPT